MAFFCFGAFDFFAFCILEQGEYDITKSRVHIITFSLSCFEFLFSIGERSDWHFILEMFHEIYDNREELMTINIVTMI